jgi:Fe-S-cluster containining protein
VIDDAVDAGELTRWLEETRQAREEDTGVDVPCGECDACCRSWLFILVTPHDTAARAKIPPELLTASPGMPEGYEVMSPDEEGRCPMLKPAGCAIYEDRPLTCRQFDCRMFAAADIYPPDRPRITERARRWRFFYEDSQAERLHEGIRDAAVFLRANEERFWARIVPEHEAQLAPMAISLGDLFLSPRTDEERVKDIEAKVLDRPK